MFIPKYRLHLTKRSFPPDRAIGLGTQVISLINSTKDFLSQHRWYGCGVEAWGEGAAKLDLSSFQLKSIGTDQDFINYCSQIDQFIWGVFVCIDSSLPLQNLQGIELGADADEFRPIPCNGVLLEIRAFDTTFIAISSEDLALMERLSKQYNVNLESAYT